jgi:hypothetical protein
MCEKTRAEQSLQGEVEEGRGYNVHEKEEDINGFLKTH